MFPYIWKILMSILLLYNILLRRSQRKTPLQLTRLSFPLLERRYNFLLEIKNLVAFH